MVVIMNESEPVLSKLSRNARKRSLPRDTLVPPPGLCVLENVDLRIDRSGDWHYNGSPIRRPELVKLFASVLRRDDSGGYWLVTPAEACRVRVEDAPFLAVAMECRNPGRDQKIIFRTNLDVFVTVDADHPIRVDINRETGEPAPYAVLDGNLEAKITRSVFYDLVDLAVERGRNDITVIGLWSKGAFFEIGELNDTNE